MSAICEFGCKAASACSGLCQPAPRTSKPCRWCAAGYSRKGRQHWIVKSVIPARIDIRECTAAAL